MIVMFRIGIPASVNWRTTRGRTREAGVGRFRSSTMIRGRVAPAHSSRMGLWPTGDSRRSHSSASVSARAVAGANTDTSQESGRSRFIVLSPYQAAVWRIMFAEGLEVEPGLIASAI